MTDTYVPKTLGELQALETYYEMIDSCACPRVASKDGYAVDCPLCGPHDVVVIRLSKGASAHIRPCRRQIEVLERTLQYVRERA